MLRVARTLRTRRLRQALVTTCLLVVCLGRQAGAQSCVGDCRGLGHVGIGDLILAVNIVLGLATLDQCPALGPAPVGINQLITSVNNALCDCQPCPPPRPTPSPTPTVPDADTPTATESPTPGPVISMWREDNLEVDSSTCPQPITDQIRQALAANTTDITVRQLGEQIELEDTAGNVISGTIDADGTVQARDMGDQSQGSCVVTIDSLLTVNLSSSPTAVMYAVNVSTMHCITSVHCDLRVTGRWTRTSAALRRRATVLGAVRAALRASL